MRIKINGHDEDIANECDIHALLKARDLKSDRVAVELNRKLVRTAQYNTILKQGDELEIVTFVGGG